MSQATAIPGLIRTPIRVLSLLGPPRGAACGCPGPIRSFRSIIWQIAIVGLVIAIGWYFIHNTIVNLDARHIATGFGFLDRVAGIPIGESLLPYNPAVNTYGRALLIGVLNTLQVAVIGVVLATILAR